MEKEKGSSMVLKWPAHQLRSFFVDGCYALLLLLYTYRGFSTITQGHSTCRRSRSLILELIWRKYRGLVIKLCSNFLERCGKLELRNLVHY